MLHVEVFPRACEIQRCRFFPVTRVLSKGIPNVEFVAGSIFVTFDRSKNIFRWDTAAKKFVIDNRFLLPIDAPDVTSFLGPVDDRNFWALTVSSDSRRLGLFSKQPDGTWHVEEDPHRGLNRLRLFQNQYSEPGGVTWITGEKLVRFRPSKNAVSRSRSRR
jgi:hypothetical protein